MALVAIGFETATAVPTTGFEPGFGPIRVNVLSPRIAFLVMRFGVTRLIEAFITNGTGGVT
jgi:hypothetical protein